MAIKIVVVLRTYCVPVPTSSSDINSVKLFQSHTQNQSEQESINQSFISFIHS